jgi:UDP-N-acetylglucosamine 4-epimerase
LSLKKLDPTRISAIVLAWALPKSGWQGKTLHFGPDAVQANLLAATAAKPEAANQVYNVALNKRTTLIELFSILKELLLQSGRDVGACEPLYREFQRGDVWHSQADITKISELLGFSPVYGVREGLVKTLPWYIETAGRTSRSFSRIAHRIAAHE